MYIKAHRALQPWLMCLSCNVQNPALFTTNPRHRGTGLYRGTSVIGLEVVNYWLQVWRHHRACASVICGPLCLVGRWTFVVFPVTYLCEMIMHNRGCCSRLQLGPLLLYNARSAGKDRAHPSYNDTRDKKGPMCSISLQDPVDVWNDSLNPGSS